MEHHHSCVTKEVSESDEMEHHHSCVTKKVPESDEMEHHLSCVQKKFRRTENESTDHDRSRVRSDFEFSRRERGKNMTDCAA